MSFIDWLSGANNPTLPKEVYQYGARHLSVWIAVVVLAIITSIIMYKRTKRTKDIFFTICAGVFLFFEIADRVVNLIFMTDYSVENIFKTILPLYFCSIAVWFFIVALFSKKDALINSSAIFGLLVTLAFFIAPAVGFNKQYVTFDCFYSIFSHSLGLFVSIVMIATRYARFNIKKIWQTFVFAVAFIIYGVAMSLWAFPGEDYMIILNNPLGINFGIPWWSMYLIFVAVWITSFYLIELIVHKIKRQIKVT